MARALVQVTAPSAEPLLLAETKQHLRVTGSDEDALLWRLIRTARLYLDGPDGVLNRALMTQTWDMKIDCFRAKIMVPLPPLQSVSFVQYLDEAGDTQTLATSMYQVAGVDSRSQGYIVEAFEETWPDHRYVPEAITIRFVAGYGSRNEVPHQLLEAMLMMVADMYENRETGVIGMTSAKINMIPGVDDLLDPFVVHEDIYAHR